jgi:hypothetical protein
MTRDRVALIGLLFWGLLMIVPDLARVVRPLASFGFYANSDGLIYDVSGPFPDEAASPAWKAGIREGDRLDLALMRCFPYDAGTCGSVLAATGGIQFVVPGRVATLDLVAMPENAARRVTLTAEVRPTNWVLRGVLLLNQLAGILVVLAAAWLVWTRPGGMSWGFFLYVLWFNPGQSFEFYALLQQHPPLLLAQNAAGSIAEAVAYAGLLLFAMRVPTDVAAPEWRPLERALPIVAFLFAAAMIASYGCLFGYQTETLTRATILMGFAVDLCALAILVKRSETQSPADYQRIRWVIWGCLIGLPAFIIADLAEGTTFFNTSWGDFTPPEPVIGLLYLVNGILCLFVFEAVRRNRVVHVSIPLRRVTILGLTLSIPVLLLHNAVERVRESFEVPSLTWLGIGAVVLFLISRLHEVAVEHADRYFNRALDRAEAELGHAILEAKDLNQIDRLMSDGPGRVLGLASAATFRNAGADFRRLDNGDGWNDTETRTIPADEPLLAPLAKGASFSIGDRDASAMRLPSGLERPVLAVAAANRIRCFAVALYGAHASGADINTYERAMLSRLGDHAADAYARVEERDLRSRIAALENELMAIRSGQ